MDYGQPDHRFHPIARSSHRPLIFNEMSLRKYSPHSTGVLSSTHSPQPRSKLSPSTQKTSSSVMVPKASRGNTPIRYGIGGRTSHLTTVTKGPIGSVKSSNGLKYLFLALEDASPVAVKKTSGKGSRGDLVTFHSLGVSGAYQDTSPANKFKFDPRIPDHTIQKELDFLDVRCHLNGINAGDAFMAVITAYPHADSEPGNASPDRRMHWTLLFLDKAGLVIEWEVTGADRPLPRKSTPPPTGPAKVLLHVIHIDSLAENTARLCHYVPTKKRFYLTRNHFNRINSQAPPLHCARLKVTAEDEKIMSRILAAYRRKAAIMSPGVGALTSSYKVDVPPHEADTWL